MPDEFKDVTDVQSAKIALCKIFCINWYDLPSYQDKQISAVLDSLRASAWNDGYEACLDDEGGTL